MLSTVDAHGTHRHHHVLFHCCQRMRPAGLDAKSPDDMVDFQSTERLTMMMNFGDDDVAAAVLPSFSSIGIPVGH